MTGFERSLVRRKGANLQPGTLGNLLGGKHGA